MDDRCVFCRNEATLYASYRNLPRGSWKDGIFCKSCLDTNKAEGQIEVGKVAALAAESEGKK